MTAEYDISKVEHLGGYRLRLTFVGGLVAEIDLATKLGGDVGPMFEPLRDEPFFARATVDEELGTVVWPNGADLASDVLYQEAMGSA